jgi:hypothetical protein
MINLLPSTHRFEHKNADLQSREHYAEFSMLKMSFHQIINEVYFCCQVLNARSNDNILEDWKQIVHAPLVFVTQMNLYDLYN